MTKTNVYPKIQSGYKRGVIYARPEKTVGRKSFSEALILCTKSHSAILTGVCLKHPDELVIGTHENCWWNFKDLAPEFQGQIIIEQ